MKEIQDLQSVKIAELEEELERLRAFAEAVIQWSEAYPESVFSDLTSMQIAEVCSLVGVSRDRISAWVLRAFTKPWGDRARKALKPENAK